MQVHPDTGISSRAISILNSFITDIFEKIATETAQLARYNKKPTVTSREIQTAVRLILPESWPSTLCLRAPRLSPSSPLLRAALPELPDAQPKRCYFNTTNPWTVHSYASMLHALQSSGLSHLAGRFI